MKNNDYSCEIRVDYFIEKYNETITETDDVRRIVEYFGSDSREIKFGQSSWDVHPLSKFSTIKILHHNNSP